ncbi:MAG: hypothetical protein JW910_15720, partial [Anaerolineae bacterium]|nr:hypothetical protein [Anaerolineae bacterium]
TFDDVLSTYIEEVGHSWQEYLYETDGLGSGPRTRPTGYYEAMHFAPGSEYQVKLYILNLDGTVLHLSAEERARFVDAICEADGYANPVGREVPAYGAPTGWPNPEGWPTVAPTEAEHAALCTTLRG